MDPSPGSANSSPRSRPDTWDDNPLPPVPGAKLRLMCSYGGHIIPRPHDKALCYVGGDTRIVVVDRLSALAELHARLSHALLNGRHFTLKYQLPTEDLDSLISVANDEDLENMIEEYDRTTSASPLKPSRLRLFLFPSKPETAASMGCLLDDAKSETWFVDALNGAGLLPRGLSESAAIDTLVELDHHGMVNSDSCADLQRGTQQDKVMAKTNAQEVVLDSPPLVETSSSFGSSSSSPSMANLPPIKVRSDGYQMAGLDEQFSHVSISSSLANAASPPLPAATSSAGVNSSSGENLNRVMYDDDKSEISDHGTVAPTGLRKPPLPLQPVQRRFVDVHNLPSPDSKHAGGYNLTSPDSIASDCSIASAGSQSKHTIYQTPVIDQKMNIIEEATSHQQHLMDSMSTQPPPYQNQQFVHQSPSTHYIQHPQMSMSSYYPMYMHPQTQQSRHHQTDPQYQMYLLPPQSTQPSYDAPSSRPLTPPPIYQTKPEMSANMHYQMPAHQYQQQYIGVSQMPSPAQSNANANYGYEYSHQMQDQMYYAQPPQYQTMTAASAVMLSQASNTQLTADSTGQ